MKVIRLGVFETNSSSTHTMIIMPEEEYKKWESGELLRYRWDDKFITREENDRIVKELIKQYAKEHNISLDEVDVDDVYSYYDEDVAYTLEEFDDRMNLENDIETYTTKNGETIVIRCWYGYEG